MRTPDRPRGFEDRLLREFKKYFDERNQTMTDTEETKPKTPWFTRGRKFSLAGAGGAVALGIGAIVALPALTASTAYAVEVNDNGEVEVNVYSPEEARELEQTLADHGVKAKVDFPPDDTMCDPARYQSTEFPPSEHGLKLVSNSDTNAGVQIGFTVDPDDFPLDGDVTMVLEIAEKYFEPSEDMTRVLSTGLAAATGEVGPCDPIEAEHAPMDDAEPADGSKGED